MRKRKAMTPRLAEQRAWKLYEERFNFLYREPHTRDMVADIVAWRQQLIASLLTTRQWYERFWAFADACERCGRDLS